MLATCFFFSALLIFFQPPCVLFFPFWARAVAFSLASTKHFLKARIKSEINILISNIYKQRQFEFTSKYCKYREYRRDDIFVKQLSIFRDIDQYIAINIFILFCIHIHSIRITFARVDSELTTTSRHSLSRVRDDIRESDIARAARAAQGEPMSECYTEQRFEILTG